jgi:hypothetical protein
MPSKQRNSNLHFLKHVFQRHKKNRLNGGFFWPEKRPILGSLINLLFENTLQGLFVYWPDQPQLDQQS